MELKHIKYLLEVSKQGSLNKAAKTLYISQPNLSTSLKEIEKEVNIKIFDRSSHGIRPTKQGAALIDSLSSIYYQMEYLLDKYKNNDPGEICLYFAHNDMFNLADAFYKFKTEHNFTSLTCEIETYHLMTVLDKVAAASHASLGVLAIPVLDYQTFKHVILSKGLDCAPLFRTHGCLIVGKQHPYFSKDRVSLDQISDCTLLFYNMSSLIQSSKFVHNLKCENINFLINSKEALFGMIANSTICGFGSSWMESSIFLNSPNLKYLPIMDKKTDLLFITVSNKGFVFDEKYEKFINYLKKMHENHYTY